MTYAELIQSLQDWLETSETTMVGELDFIIELSEKRIYRSIDLDNGWKYTSAAMSTGAALFTLPTDSVVIRSVTLVVANVRTQLLQKDASFIDDYTGNRVTTGVPRYYAPYTDTQILLGPTPNSTDSLDIAHTFRPTQLSASQTTTWLSLEAPDVLLYACLKELCTFLMKEKDMIARYDQMYQEAFQGSILEENFRKRTDAYRDREIKVVL